MCWICDHPGATPADYKARITGLIGQYGWAIQGVERDGPHPPWAYTTGLTGQGRPELVITGMELGEAAELLNLAAGLPPGTLVPGTYFRLRSTSARVIEVTAPWAHLNVAVDVYGEDITALQLVFADDRGRWPWEPGFTGLAGGQPVLGEHE
jgi:hypothetical protein